MLPTEFQRPPEAHENQTSRLRKKVSFTPPVLRHYQFDSVEAVFNQWETCSSTMVVLATGLGKTVTFCEVVRRLHPKRSIIIAHRTELIEQACAALKRIGLSTEIEMAEHKADASMFHNSGRKESKRMTKFRPQDFDCLVIDECHHSTASSYRAVIDHFRQNPNLKILMVTATPDRADEKALGLVCESVAFKFDIADAIEDGWLVPIQQQLVRVASLDYSHVRTTAGDLNGADLARIMEDEKNLQGMVGASIEIIGTRKSIAFTSSVRHAEMCCDIFNRHRAGMADWICGSTSDDDRKRILRRFKAGEVQVLANVGIATEGFDDPSVEVIIMGRATKSRSLYTQMVGRGTRPLPGVIDGLNSSYERRDAIAESAKPSAVVLDFVGNSGKHKLMTTADILGGDYTEEEKEEALKDIERSGKPKRISEAIKELRLRIEQQKAAEAARKARLVAKVNYAVRPVSPFDAFDIKPRQDSKWDTGKPLSEKQRAVLQKMGVNPDELNYAAAKQLLHLSFKRRESGLCSIKQAQVLKKHGYEPKKMTFQEASKIIDSLKQSGWKRADLALT
jgi:superfamily II DNA or RNA helicase